MLLNVFVGETIVRGDHSGGMHHESTHPVLNRRWQWPSRMCSTFKSEYRSQHPKCLCVCLCVSLCVCVCVLVFCFNSRISALWAILLGQHQLAVFCLSLRRLLAEAQQRCIILLSLQQTYMYK